MQNAVSIFTNIGRLSMAAKHLKDMAEIYEKEDNAEDALTFYQQAADLYAGEEVNRCAVWPLCEGSSQ
jgi:alpha-soluble NSF attachment protein